MRVRRCPATCSVVIRNCEPVSSMHPPFSNVPSRIFGPCRSSRMPACTPVSAASFPDHVHAARMIFLNAMRGVQSENIDARIEQFPNRIRRIGRGS